VLNRLDSTIRSWLMAMQLAQGHAAGHRGRYDIVNPGTPSRPDSEQLRQLKENLVDEPQSCVLEPGTRTARLVAEHVRRRFGIQYKTVSMYGTIPVCPPPYTPG